MTVPSLIDVPEALDILRRWTSPGPVGGVPLQAARGLRLAEPIHCDVDFPPFDRSLMDGYAVRAAETAGAPVRLRVAGSIPAGRDTALTLSPGEALQINTGAAIPSGADAVVRVESTRMVGGEDVEILESVEPGRFITPRSSMFRRGDEVVASGAVLGPAEMSAAASAGVHTPRVYIRPEVAVLSTGDELIDVNQSPTGSQIRDSNGVLLQALVESTGATVRVLPRVGDEPGRLGEVLAAGLRSSVLCVTGGISMGAYDHVPDVLLSLGVQFHFRRMRIKPGRPVIFGTHADGCCVLALPGNPASAFVGFELLVRQVLSLRGGGSCGLFYRRGVLEGRLPPAGDRRTYRPARLSSGSSGVLVHPLPWRGSGDPFGMVGADVLVEQSPGSGEQNRGDEVKILPRMVGETFLRQGWYASNQDEDA